MKRRGKKAKKMKDMEDRKKIFNIHIIGVAEGRKKKTQQNKTNI